MENMDKYIKIFMDTFEEEEEAIKTYCLNVTEKWNSVAHMNLIVGLEDEFDIELEPDDILAITSFEKGIEVLKKYNIF
ncbi:MAG: acyl carrier protein [Roseburia sp.]|nr:acyl carrier protein [Roseburia sp.]